MTDEGAQLGLRRKWTEKRVIDELINVARRGVPLTFQGLRDAGEHRLLHVIHHYGGLPRLRELAELPRPKKGHPRGPLSADRVTREIRQRYASREPLMWQEIPAQLQAAAKHHFGSWYSAITAAGLEFGQAMRSSK